MSSTTDAPRDGSDFFLGLEKAASKGAGGAPNARPRTLSFSREKIQARTDIHLNRQRKEAESMQKSLGAGDKVITIGGLYGTVVSTDDESVTLEIAPGVTARYARQAVGRVTEQVKAPTEHVVDNPVKEEK